VSFCCRGEGYVYYDANNDGIKQGNESGIGGTMITSPAPTTSATR